MSVRPRIAPLQRNDIPELSQFLIRGFGVPADSTFFSHEVLTWKYFDGPGGASEDSSCSLIARSSAKIVGHIGICYRQLIVLGDESISVPTMHAIDWLGSTEHPGSGGLLMMEAFATCKTQFAVGGSEQAQSLFPRLGFEQKPKVSSYRKVLSPYYRFRATGQRFFRKWAGTAKDMASVWLARRPRLKQTVELRAVDLFTVEIDRLRRQSSERIVMCQHDHALLNYWLRYPLSGFSGYTIHADGRTIGAAILKITPNGRIRIGKIVDCWLETDDPSCWLSAVAALVEQLRSLSADDVTCYGTTPSFHAALLSNGFTKSGESNVYIRDKQQLLPRDLPFGLSGFEADGAIL